MNRLLAIVVGLGIVVPSGMAQPHGYESIPDDHREPLIVRVLDGKSGDPVADLHLLLTSGYTGQDLERRLWTGEIVTDASGNARLPSSLLNLPFLRVSMRRAPACEPDAGRHIYNVARIRNEGFAAVNRCGAVAAVNAPGVLTLFARFSAPSHPAALSPAAAPRPAPSGSDTPIEYPASQREPLFSPLQAIAPHPPQADPHKAESPPADPNELQQLRRHQAPSIPSPPPAPAQKSSAPASSAGTSQPAAAYEEMCQPGL